MHDKVRTGEALSIRNIPRHRHGEYDVDVSDILAGVVPTPRSQAPRMDPETAKLEIARHHREIMEILGLDLGDDSLSETPDRVAKMYVDEIFGGLRDDSFPKITVVENKMSYDEMLVEINITFNSTCEHHFLPILGKAHVAYLCKGWVLGLSKFNRVVDFFARRPQVQERATVQIQQALSRILRTDDVAVVVDAMHCCVKTRGIGDDATITRTSKLSGAFQSNPSLRSEFYSSIPAPDRLKIT
jgi:GTP cyclohydrolase IA